MVPAYRLEAREEPWPLDAVLEQLDGPDGLVEGNDHFEFYWFPHTRRALTKRNNRVPDDVVRPPAPGCAGGSTTSSCPTRVFSLANGVATLAPSTTASINGFAARALSLAPLHGTVRRGLRLARAG